MWKGLVYFPGFIPKLLLFNRTTAILQVLYEIQLTLLFKKTLAAPVSIRGSSSMLKNDLNVSV